MDVLTISAASGLRSRMQSLDILANNLANSATGGFKSDREFYGLYNSDDSVNAEGDGPSSTLPVIERGWIDFSQGLLQSTGNPLDVAISGKGFFAVKGPTGPLYTRNGNLKVLSSGVLATGEDYPVLGADGQPIHVAPAKTLEISPDGIVHQDGQAIGQIGVVNFKSTDSLRKTGNTCFQNADPKNTPAPATGVEVLQGKSEGSNVPVAEAAMHLVGVMRQFEMLQKAVSVSSDMDSKTIQEVARVGS